MRQQLRQLVGEKFTKDRATQLLLVLVVLLIVATGIGAAAPYQHGVATACTSALPGSQAENAWFVAEACEPFL